ncbi:hypothetical protein [Malikia spinosa]|uniref:hypothetical protein n=1 Tax=Malikia spinosa TaxID=86180 RepID=UPI0027BA1ABB|nr:hypothetical protein [Malikia spinosa]
MEIVALVKKFPYDIIFVGNTLCFYMPGDCCKNKEDSEKYDCIEGAVQEFFSLQWEFCDYVRKNYFEIDLAATSLTARKFHAKL